jgi:hypothetical protein
LAATNDIVRCHAHFAYMMAQRINGSSEFNEDMPEFAKVMATASTSLSKQIVNMKVDLAQLVSALEEIEVKRKQSILQRILAWLEGFLKGIVEVFSYGPSKASPQYVLGMVRIPPLSNLCREAAELCKNASGMSRRTHTPLIPAVRMNK